MEQIAADDPRLVGAMADRLADTAVWLRHEGPTGVDGVALNDVWPDGVWMLTYLGVVPSTRGRGVGRRLASAVRSEAARAGATSVAAEVDDGNAADRACLAAAGFTIRARRTNLVRQLT